MNRRLAAALATLAVLAAAGAAYAATRPAAAALDGSGWVLALLDGRPPTPETVVTLTFEGGRAGGSDGCNRYGAPYTQAGGGLRLTAQAATTLRACPEPLMRQGAAYLSALAQVEGFRIEDGRLTLLGPGGRPLASFDPQPTTLAGTTWKVTAYNNGAQAVTSVASGSEITMAFGSDGKLTGSAGCNTYTASYEVAGKGLKTGAAATTRRACGEPPRVMEQEAQFLKALATAASYRREGNTLEVRDAGGALAVTATLR